MNFFSVNFNDGCYVFGVRDIVIELRGMRRLVLVVIIFWGSIFR